MSSVSTAASPDSPGSRVTWSAAQPLLVCYHDRCPDGGCAAAIAKSQVPNAELVPVQYGQPVPDAAGRDVQFVDFCPTTDALKALVFAARSVDVIDHHKTGVERLAAFHADPEVAALLAREPARFRSTFDMAKSGAMLTWERYHGIETPAPDVVRYVQDRDLWQHALPDTKAVNAGIYLGGMAPDRMAVTMATPVADLSVVGQAHLDAMDRKIAAYRARAVEVDFAGYRVLATQIDPSDSDLRSDLGHTLATSVDATGSPYPFSVVHYLDRARIKMSMRRPDAVGAVDLSVLASRFSGGGGHPGAASATVDELPWAVSAAALTEGSVSSDGLSADTDVLPTSTVPVRSMSKRLR